MLLQILLILAGLITLLVSGDLLVRGAVDLARALGIPALIVSLTIVAFGTSAPELMVSINAVLSDSGGIAIGNIIGSNIANILMVLGIPAIIYPISANVPQLRRHGSVMALATGAFVFIAYQNGAILPWHGVVLFVGLLCYLAYMLYMATNGKGTNPVLDEIEEYSDNNGITITTIIMLVVGFIGLPLGAHLLVTHGASLASDLGVRQELIGLTIIAFGTSLPELATVLSAAIQRKSDVAIGSIVGSNIFNLLAVGAATGIFGGANFNPTSLRLDIPVMLAATVLLVAFIYSRRDIGRPFGILMSLGYILFCYMLIQGG